MSIDGLFGPFVAFLAGLLSFLSPCVLPLVPVYIAQMAGTATDGGASRRVTLTHALSFVAGFSLVFIALGASVGLIGYGLKDHQRDLAVLAGIFIIVMGMHLTGLLRIPVLYRTYAVPVGAGAGGGTLSVGGGAGGKRAGGRLAALGYGRSSLVGAGFALGWTPCIGPVLGSILTLAQAQGTVGRSILLLVFYSLGLGVPFIVTGMAVGSVTGYLKRINRFLPAIEVGSGALLIFVGVLLIAGRMTMFNSYFDHFGRLSRGL
ncbi:MAG TPA: cytochrome c biogenesis protein CcdA [Dehalococcoidia bacterium]|nr:cytochrome c biogenesis protein CcdA [Dehalococcoidia bacterium]